MAATVDGDRVTRDDLKIGMQALLDFIIIAGSTLGGAMLESGIAVIPGPAVQLLAVIMGATGAARRIQTMLDGSPRETLTETVKQLVAQMRTVQVATAQVLPEPPRPAPAPARRWEDVVAKAQAQAKLDAVAATAPLTPTPTRVEVPPLAGPTPTPKDL